MLDLFDTKLGFIASFDENGGAYDATIISH